MKQSSRETSTSREISNSESHQQSNECVPMTSVSKSAVLSLPRNPSITTMDKIIASSPQVDSSEHRSRCAIFKSTNNQSFMPVSKPNSTNNNQLGSLSFPKVNSQQMVHKKFTHANKNSNRIVKPQCSNYSSSITLVVDDTRFIVDPEIFKQHSNTMLGRMFR